MLIQLVTASIILLLIVLLYIQFKSSFRGRGGRGWFGWRGPGYRTGRDWGGYGGWNGWGWDSIYDYNYSDCINCRNANRVLGVQRPCPC